MMKRFWRRAEECPEFPWLDWPDWRVAGTKPTIKCPKEVQLPPAKPDKPKSVR